MKNIIKALEIFLKYDNPEYPFHCEHDKLYVNIDPEKVSDEDIVELDNLGFFVDEEWGGDGFASYKYGSC